MLHVKLVNTLTIIDEQRMPNICFNKIVKTTHHLHVVTCHFIYESFIRDLWGMLYFRKEIIIELIIFYSNDSVLNVPLLGSNRHVITYIRSKAVSSTYSLKTTINVMVCQSIKKIMCYDKLIDIAYNFTLLICCTSLVSHIREKNNAHS